MRAGHRQLECPVSRAASPLTTPAVQGPGRDEPAVPGAEGGGPVAGGDGHLGTAGSDRSCDQGWGCPARQTLGRADDRGRRKSRKSDFKFVRRRVLQVGPVRMGSRTFGQCPSYPRGNIVSPGSGRPPADPKGLPALVPSPGPPMPIPPTASGALARIRQGSARTGSVPTSRSTSQSAGRSFPGVGSGDPGSLAFGGRRVLVEHAVFIER
jgi:hypothetical protein